MPVTDASPVGHLQGEIPLAAADVGDIERRQQVAERRAPTPPSCARAPAGAVAVRVEALLPVPQHFLEPRFVFADHAVAGRGGELRLEERPDDADGCPAASRARR